MSFSVISENFLFFGWLFKISLFWHLGPESLNPKNTIKIGVSGPFFWKADVCHETAVFGPKNPKFYKFQLSFVFACFLLFQQYKNTKIRWNPYFYSVLANLKKENFENLNLKHWKLENPIFAPFYWKRLFFRKLPQNWGQKKHKMITECAKQISWNHYFI